MRYYQCLNKGTFKVDGQTLLYLREEDLRLPPLSMNCLGDIKRLSAELKRLQSKFSDKNGFKLDQNGNYANRLTAVERFRKYAFSQGQQAFLEGRCAEKSY